MVDPRNFLFNSDFPIDQVLEVVDSDTVGSIAIPANTFVTVTKPTVIQEAMFPVGRFSIQGVSAFAPVPGRIYIPSTPSLFSAGVVVYIKSSPGYLTFYISNTDTSSAHTIDFEIAMLARSDQGAIEPQSLPSSFTFDTDLNYLKIAMDEITPVTAAAASGGNTSVTASLQHGLGYVPTIRAFMEYGGEFLPAGQYIFDLIPTYVSIYPSIDDQEIHFDIFNRDPGLSPQPARDYRIHTRIYYDS